tara:strand:- start:395 stop:913 length:519 start_codon:yes stop_codon:yes gene_type:complete
MNVAAVDAIQSLVQDKGLDPIWARFWENLLADAEAKKRISVRVIAYCGKHHKAVLASFHQAWLQDGETGSLKALGESIMDVSQERAQSAIDFMRGVGYLAVEDDEWDNIVAKGDRIEKARSLLNIIVTGDDSPVSDAEPPEEEPAPKADEDEQQEQGKPEGAGDPDQEPIPF